MLWHLVKVAQSLWLFLPFWVYVWWAPSSLRLTKAHDCFLTEYQHSSRCCLQVDLRRRSGWCSPCFEVDWAGYTRWTTSSRCKCHARLRRCIVVCYYTESSRVHFPGLRWWCADYCGVFLDFVVASDHDAQLIQVDTLQPWKVLPSVLPHRICVQCFRICRESIWSV